MRSRELTEYYARIHDAVSSISFDIQPSDSAAGYTMTWPSTHTGPSPLAHPSNYRHHARRLLTPLTRPSSSPPAPPTTATQIYPIFQFTPLVVAPDTTSTELPALTFLLQSLTTPPFAPCTWTFTAGYFNTTAHLRDLLLASAPRSATIIAAAPQANGFYGSRGVSGMLPAAYTLLARRFLDAAERQGLVPPLRMLEWRRGTVGEPEGWTYHAKGLWVTLPGGERGGPSVTLVGSSNYTKRSYGLDLEAGALVVTRDEGLRGRLREEEGWLADPRWAREVGRREFDSDERRVGWRVRLALWVVGVVGGAL